MAQTKQPYETTFIVNASLEDTQVDAVANHIQEVITRNGGDISAVNRWGRKRLAYTIKKKNNGFYVNIEFSALGPVIGQLERNFLLEENVLRFLTIRLDKRALQARMQPAALASSEPLPAASTIAATPPAVTPREPLFSDEPAEDSSATARS